LARELGAQMLGLFGEETQYCWTMLRRRLNAQPPPTRLSTPQLLLAGHTDDLNQREIALHGPRPYLTLVLNGEFSEWDDADSLVVEIGGQARLPRYAGTPGAEILAALPDQPPERLLQVNVGLDSQLPFGTQAVRVRCFDGAASNPAFITLSETYP
jgi:hypothetical protein